MKVTTKITERDKKLLVFLAVFLILVITAVAGILPAYDRITALDEEIESAEKLKEGMDQKIASAAEYRSVYDTLTAEFTDASKNYYDLMENQQIDRTITSKVLGCGVEAQNMTITQQADPVSIPLYGTSTEENGGTGTQGESETGEAERSGNDIYAAEVTLDVKGDRAKVQNLIDLFANDAGMRIITLEYNNDSKKDTAEAAKVSVTLELYMCLKE